MQIIYKTRCWLMLSMPFLFILSSFTSQATIYTFTRALSGSQEVPANNSPATGTITGTYNDVTNTLTYSVTFSGLLSPTVAGHFHAPAPPGMNAGVVIGFPNIPTGVTSGSFSNSHVLTDAQETQLLSGLWYANIHTTGIPSGEIRGQIFFDGIAAPASITCPSSITVSNAPGQCNATVAFAATSPNATLIHYRIGNTAITSPRTFAVGTYTVTATALTAGGFVTCTFTVTVNDTEAPLISTPTTDPSSLWPANHKMRNVTVNYSSTDNCSGAVTCQLSVSSNEAANDKGDGNTAPDWMIINDHNLQLRAERSGKGSGRVYTITVTCRDAAGNASSRTATVTVPHHGPASSITASEAEQLLNEGLVAKPLPGAGKDYFTINIRSLNSTEKVSVLLYDLAGRLVDSRNNVNPGETIMLGKQLNQGIYLLEMKQGSEVRKMKISRNR